jgi:hypothetical protein
MKLAMQCFIVVLLFSIASFAGEGKKVTSTDQQSEVQGAAQKVVKVENVRKTTVHAKVKTVKAKPAVKGEQHKAMMRSGKSATSKKAVKKQTTVQKPQSKKKASKK